LVQCLSFLCDRQYRIREARDEFVPVNSRTLLCSTTTRACHQRSHSLPPRFPYACASSIYPIVQGAWFLVGFGGGVPRTPCRLLADENGFARRFGQDKQAKSRVDKSPSLSGPGGAVGPAVHSRLSLAVVILFRFPCVICRCWYVVFL